ncbi:family 78 glycoside hydrolase catalytic domain [candidate division KSB1 bacterium]|nr:family 78 glycoside hydrolase catalytic domain [candidate division KSB1 bacterium]
MKPSHLSCNFRKAALGMPRQALTFNWRIPDGTQQHAYQVRIFDLKTTPSTNIYDTGKIESRSARCVIDAANVPACGIYNWQVRFWNKENSESEYSEPQFLAVGPDEDKAEWQAYWIQPQIASFPETKQVLHAGSGKMKAVDGLADLHFYLRKHFTAVPSSIRKAICFVTADDYYKLYLNDQYIGQGPAPAYLFDYYYNTFDVTEHLKQDSEHCLAADCYYQGLHNRVWVSGDKQFGFLLQLHIYFEDGSLQIVATDSGWRSAVSKAYAGDRITAYDTQFLEDWDARQALAHWRRPEFDDSDWLAAREVAIPPLNDHRLHPQPTPPLQRYAIKPNIERIIGDSVLWFDFGAEVVGTLVFTFRGDAWQTLEIRHGEELNEDGRVRYDMRASTIYQEFITLDTASFEFEFYDYKAFRYVEILLPNGVETEVNDVRVYVRHFPVPDVSSRFRSSDPNLNAIWELCRYTVEMGTQEGYLDCPTREKGQYLGDVYVAGLSHIWHTGELTLLKKALRHYAQSLKYKDIMLAVAPSALKQDIPDYSLLLPELLLEFYRHSGDRLFLQEMYTSVCQMMTAFEKWRTDEGLLSRVEGFVVVDWPPNLRDEYDMKAAENGVNTALNAFYYNALKKSAAIAVELNQIDNARKFEMQADMLRIAFLKILFDESAGLFKDADTSSHHSLHANVLPLLFDMVDDSQRTGILNFVSSKGLACGVYFANFVLKALFQAGEWEAAYRLLCSDGLHSWLNMIRKGATTTLEAWDPDLKWNTSFCHPWATCPISIISEQIMGISPLNPGWDRVRIAPRFPADLQQAEILLPTLQGEIEMKIQRTEKKLFMNLKIPGGMQADVHLPDPGKRAIVTINRNNVAFEKSGGWLRCTERLASGEYRIELSMK